MIVKKRDDKRLFRKRRCRPIMENSIKMVLKRVVCRGVEWFQVQVGINSGAVVKTEDAP
jgi:hypothetical protein